MTQKRRNNGRNKHNRGHVSPSGAPTAPRLAPRTRPSASSSSGTSWRPPPLVTSPTTACTLDTPYPNSTPSFTTASLAPSTPRSSGTGQGPLGRTGPHHFASCAADPLEPPGLQVLVVLVATSPQEHQLEWERQEHPRFKPSTFNSVVSLNQMCRQGKVYGIHA